MDIYDMTSKMLNFRILTDIEENVFNKWVYFPRLRDKDVDFLFRDKFNYIKGLSIAIAELILENLNYHGCSRVNEEIYRRVSSMSKLDGNKLYLITNQYFNGSGAENYTKKLEKAMHSITISTIGIEEVPYVIDEESVFNSPVLNMGEIHHYIFPYFYTEDSFYLYALSRGGINPRIYSINNSAKTLRVVETDDSLYIDSNELDNLTDSCAAYLYKLLKYKCIPDVKNAILESMSFFNIKTDTVPSDYEMSAIISSMAGFKFY